MTVSREVNKSVSIGNSLTIFIVSKLSGDWLKEVTINAKSNREMAGNIFNIIFIYNTKVEAPIIPAVLPNFAGIIIISGLIDLRALL